VTQESQESALSEDSLTSYSLIKHNDDLISLIDVFLEFQHNVDYPDSGI